jgi:hypothetical protein
MTGMPRLVINGKTTGEPICYRCSVCDEVFLLHEDRTPKEAAAELLAVFSEHVREKHSDDSAA